MSCPASLVAEAFFSIPGTGALTSSIHETRFNSAASSPGRTGERRRAVAPEMVQAGCPSEGVRSPIWLGRVPRHMKLRAAVALGPHEALTAWCSLGKPDPVDP